MKRALPPLEVEAPEPITGRRTVITWIERGFGVNGDNHTQHGGSSRGPDGFDLVATALGQRLRNTLLARAERDGVALIAARPAVSAKSRLQENGIPPYIGALFEIDLHIEGDADEPACVELEHVSRTHCDVRETLLQTPRIEERIDVVGG